MVVRKATRVSRAASRAEALSMLAGVRIDQFISRRIAEPFIPACYGISQPSPVGCLEIQNLNGV
eukprot:8149260-Lingulodinium_polyedra.AAC.1